MTISPPTRISAIAFSVGLSTSTFVAASPWIDTQDPYLKSSIRALANGGIIKAPVNTYPLMFKSIAADLKAAHKGKIPQHLLYALKHVEHALKHGQQKRTTGVKIKAASKTNDFQSFGERYAAKGEVNLFNEIISDNWAFKSSIHYSLDPYNNQKRSYEDSYLATFFGNWVVSLDQIGQWWGPGNDSTLALSNNAIAFPAVRFTRHNSSPIDFPVLNWLGPVSMTTYFGQQEHSNTLNNIRTWGARLNFKPTDSLEIGFTRTAQWGGQNRPNGFSTFIDLLAGSDNAGVGGEISAEKEPGNQLAGIDFHWNQSLFDHDFGFYGEFIGEDESGGMPSHVIYQLGMETTFGDDRNLYHLFAEFSDTFVNCNDDASTGNCAYEHHIYTEGYRRYGRSMGSTYDSDAQVFTVGLNGSQIGGVSWFSKVKLMKLNKDNLPHWSGPHPISPLAQDRIQFEGGYRMPLFKGLLNLEGTLYHSKIKSLDKTDTKASFRASWEYRF